MKGFNTKFRLIFLPFLLIGCLNITGYTFVHWLLCIKTSFLVIDEQIANVIVPLVLTGIPLLIWLRPRLKLLVLKSKAGKGDYLTGYLMLSWMAIGIPTVIAQAYLITATGKITAINYVSQINNTPPTKYYSIKHYYIDTSIVTIKSTFSVSGKYNKDFNMHLYAPCPIYDMPSTNSSSDSTAGGVEISKTIEVGNDPLIVVDGKPASKEQLKQIDPARVQSIDVLKPQAVNPLY